MNQVQSRPRVLGPCYRCGGFGHLAESCPVKDKITTAYPLYQPVVSSAESSELSLCDGVCVERATFETGHTTECVDKERVMVSVSQVASKQCVNGQVTFDELWDPEESLSVANTQRDQGDIEYISKFWEGFDVPEA